MGIDYMLGSLITILPLFLAFQAGVMTRWTFNERYAASRIACAEIVKEIHLYHGSIGKYSLRSGVDQNNQTNHVHAADRKAQAREVFQGELNRICRRVSVGVLKDTHVEDCQMKPDEVADYILEKVYAREKPGLWTRFWRCLSELV